ncbi:hypothetical protein WMF41_34145 [Sorangium sp. So ce1151]
MRTDSVRKERRLGYPAHAAPGVGGGYQLGAGKELPPLPLEDDEAVAVGLRTAATGSVKELKEASVRPELRELIERLRRLADRLGRAATSSC